MELEVGKTYMTRGGQKVFIDAILSGNPFTGEYPITPVFGYIGAATCSWRLDGTTGDRPDEFDIVSEFEDYVSVQVFGHEDIDTGEQGARTFSTHREAFESCTIGWKVVELTLVQRV